MESESPCATPNSTIPFGATQPSTILTPTIIRHTHPWKAKHHGNEKRARNQTYHGSDTLVAAQRCISAMINAIYGITKWLQEELQQFISALASHKAKSAGSAMTLSKGKHTAAATSCSTKHVFQCVYTIDACSDTTTRHHASA